MNNEYVWWLVILVAVGIGAVVYLALGPVPEVESTPGLPADAGASEPTRPGQGAPGDPAASSPVSTSVPGPAEPGSTSDTP